MKKERRIVDESDLTVPSSYQPMSEKEAEVACQYDYPFEDMRTTEELCEDLNTIMAQMSMGRKRLF